MKKISLLITGLLFVCQSLLFAQNIRITGTVTEKGSETPIPFVGIQVKGTTVGASTMDNGTYTITAPSNGTLIFSSIGYKQVEVPVSGRLSINITMEQDALALEDVLVVAYGTAKKGSFTGSAAVVDRSKIQSRSVA
ncbi:MAG: SusC/RagA family TonB-linked outer membrane protein, partial [Bacteroidales bacterium]|nr:SusC/RagA family TonB-linked outer membrane protein [Bacteroidales bacterium]